MGGQEAEDETRDGEEVQVKSDSESVKRLWLVEGSNRLWLIWLF